VRDPDRQGPGANGFHLAHVLREQLVAALQRLVLFVEIGRTKQKTLAGNSR
jgi:hypothetical protein